MSARPFTPSEILTLETRLLAASRLRDRMLLIAGTNVGYRITELLTWTIGQVRTASGEVAREVSVTRALLKGGSGVRKRSVRSRRVVLNEQHVARSATTSLRLITSRRPMNSSSNPAKAVTVRCTARKLTES